MRTVLKQSGQFSSQYKVQLSVWESLYLRWIAHALITKLRHVGTERRVGSDEFEDRPDRSPLCGVDGLLLFCGQ